MNVIARIKNASLYPLAYSVVASQSVIARAKAFRKKTVVHFQKTYAGEKILLIALYEKGRLRPDILILLETAKLAGFYVIAVNTLKVLQPDSLKDRIDCYIERPNFGRDFGSYQTGFLHIFKQSWETQCPRLLMLNDSLFYSKQNLAVFLEKMTNTDIEVLGATENFDEEYHLGSFCISFCNKVIKSKKFQKYWITYKNSNIRPKVIDNGEKALSRTIKRCVIDTANVRALFDVTWLSSTLGNNADLIDSAFNLRRESMHPWPQRTLKKIFGIVSEKFLFIDFKLANIEGSELFVVSNLKDLASAVESNCSKDSAEISELIYKVARNEILSDFKVGSQIHQNAILLHSFGLPAVKLDVLYRGVLSVRDIEEIASQLQEEERALFLYQMHSRPFGVDTLTGWRRAAFNQGLI